MQIIVCGGWAVRTSCLNCMGYPARWPHMLGMAHLDWQAAHENHSHRVVTDRPSDGFVVVHRSCKHVQYHSGGPRPSLVLEVH